MAARLAALSVGAGVAAAHRDGAHGSVVGTFRHGCYVQVEHGVYAVAGPSVVPGPIHLVVAEPPRPVAEGLAVWRTGDRLRSTGWEVDLGSVPAYAPSQPHGPELLAARPALHRMLGRLAVPDDLASRWDEVRAAVEAGDLGSLRTLLEGRGIGLTPTGDDVLAGVLLVRAWCGDDSAWLRAAAQAAATTRLSRSFLAWAAQGQSLAPVHGLVAAAADDERFDHLVDTIASIGASSGTALLWGIGLAALSPAPAAADRLG
ncbi:hypothetical protein GCM10027062_22590 [Nocardioides hungaricus]